jgi:hypothetical protein
LPNQSGAVQLSAMEFKQRLIVSCEGERGSGKSAFGVFAVMVRPPLSIHRFDYASEGVLRYAQKMGFGDDIYVYDYNIDLAKDKAEQALVARDLIKEVKGGGDKAVIAARQRADAALDASRSEADEVRKVFMGNYHEGIERGGTTLIETGTELYTLIRLAELGLLKQVPAMYYEKVNKAMDALIADAVFAPGVNLIINHKCREGWEDYQDQQGNRKSKRSGRMEMQGYDGIDYAAHAMVRMYREGTKSDPELADKKKFTEIAGDFMMQILKCNERGELVGQTYKIEDVMNGFDQLGKLIHEEEWTT